MPKSVQTMFSKTIADALVASTLKDYAFIPQKEDLFSVLGNQPYKPNK
jgi:hypothetical protein